MKANDLGKLGIKRRAAGSKRNSAAAAEAGGGGSSKRLQTDPDDEPWQTRFQNGKPKKTGRLIELSDDE